MHKHAKEKKSKTGQPGLGILDLSYVDSKFGMHIGVYEKVCVFVLAQRA